MKLVRGSREKAEMTSVAAAYATSGQKKRGTPSAVRSWTICATQQTIISARRMLAAAIEICSDATKHSSNATVTRSSAGAVRGCVMLIAAVVISAFLSIFGLRSPVSGGPKLSPARLPLRPVRP